MFVNVSVDVSVRTTPSISILTLSAVTVVVIPVPPSIVKVSPKSIAEVAAPSPVIVIVEFVNDELGKDAKALEGILVIVFDAPLIVLFVKVVPLPNAVYN